MIMAKVDLFVNVINSWARQQVRINNMHKFCKLAREYLTSSNTSSLETGASNVKLGSYGNEWYHVCESISDIDEMRQSFCPLR